MRELTGWIGVAALSFVAAASAQDAPAPQPAPAAPVESPAPQELVPLLRKTPAYPREALRNGISGFVEFEVVVNPDGTVKSARPVKADPPKVFEAAAWRALTEWRFRPRLIDGKAVEHSGLQRIEFRLESSADKARDACEAARTPWRSPTFSLSSSFSRRYEKAVAAINASDYVRAEALAREMLEKGGSPVERGLANQMLGGALLGARRNDEAIQAYEAALATQGLPWSIHDQMLLNLAKVHARAGRVDRARVMLDQYLKEACAPSDEARELLARLAAPPADPPR